MLDYTSLFRDRLGVVSFTAASIRYVPTTSGIYQIIPTPFTYAELARQGLGSRYLSALHGRYLDTSKKLVTELAAADRSIAVTVSDTTALLEKEFNECPADAILDAAILFPPFYIGQAENLRERFTDHVQGHGSPVLDRLKEAGLDKAQTFFRWTTCPPDLLTALETVLIKSHKPALNIQLR